MPTATVNLLTPRFRTPIAHDSFPTTAATRERNRERQQRRLSKRGDIRAEPHQHEEHGHEKRGHGLEELAERSLAPLNEDLRMRIFQHETRSKRANQGRKADRAGRPGQEEAEAETNGEQARHQSAAVPRGGTRSA